MEATAEKQAKFPIPAVIKRNTAFLSLSQAFVGAGLQMGVALGALAVLQLTGSAVLSGVGAALTGGGRFLVAYPSGRIADRFGRRSVLFLGFGLSMIGATLTGLAIIRSSFPLIVLGFLILGLGMGAVQLIRVAASDMYPSGQRGLGMGFVLMGSLAGALAAPFLVEVAEGLSPSTGIDPLGLPWLFVPLLVIPAIFLVLAVRPDPQQVAMNLDKYYPGCQPASPPDTNGQSKVTIGTLVRHYPRLTAIVCSFAVQGNMAMMMFLTSLVLHHHGHGLPAISASVSIHVAGMYAFTVPLGRLTDRIGRKAVMVFGVIVAGAGSMLVPSSNSYWIITSGTFLVGLGWSAVYVAATALIADTSPPEERGRAVGVNDTFSYIPATVLPLVAGPLVVAAGMGAAGLFGMFLMVPPLVLLMRLREPSPGTYTWGAKTVPAD